MKVFVCPDVEDVDKTTSKIIIESIKKNKKLKLGLATGKTMIGVYKKLVDAYKSKKVDFSRVKSFNLDEYVGLNIYDKNSFRYFMEKYFFTKVNIRKENINFLNGSAKDTKKECLEYEKAIKKAGGIDLQMLGIGRNGHIGFNEPCSSFRSKTREVKLSKQTVKDNSRYFSKEAFIPAKALTMGISTILRAKKIILIAKGKGKADAVKKIIEKKVSTKVPASFLQNHKNTVVLLDKQAASKLK